MISYIYDGVYRLSQAAYSSGECYQYSYDQVGNRMVQTTTVGATTYQYDAANRLTNAGGVNYTWDNAGNLRNDGSSLYRYDQASRLISTTQGSKVYTFNYNGDGARLKQIVNGAVTTYTQDLAASLPVVLQSKTVTATTQYVYDMDTSPLAQSTSGAWQYLLPDGLGSVRQIADAGGNVVLTEGYDPYGNVLNNSGKGSSVYGFTGEERDGSGLTYLRARYMQPKTGIFLSRDPANGDAMRPGSMNGFNYTSGNPINRVDPNGLCDHPYNAMAYCWWLHARIYYDYGVPLQEDTTESTLEWYYATYSGLTPAEIKHKYEKEMFEIVLKRQEAQQQEALNRLPYLFAFVCSLGEDGMPSEFLPEMAVSDSEAMADEISSESLANEISSGSMASTFDLAQKVSSDLNGSLTEASGEGWKVTLENAARGGRDIIVRIMQQGGQRAEPYFRVSVEGKSSLTEMGQYSSDPALTHFTIDPNNLLGALQKIVELVNGVKK